MKVILEGKGKDFTPGKQLSIEEDKDKRFGDCLCFSIKSEEILVDRNSIIKIINTFE